jgi:hypothetical protein
MSFKEFIREKKDVDTEDKEMGAIIEYFSTHDHPEDEDIHRIAKSFGYVEGDKGKTIHEFEDKIYSLLSDLFSAGKFKKNPIEPDEEELKKGIKYELEVHTKSKAIARKLALDNISYKKDFYTNIGGK